MTLDPIKALQEQAAAYAKLTAAAKAPATSTPKISASVGANGKNIKADVITVQKLLNSRMSTKLAVDGVCGPKTKAAITAFQKNVVKLAKPDGRIDVNGKTWNALIKNSAPATPKPNNPTPDTPKAGTSLSGSVGEGGKNIKADVVTIQVLLNKKNKSYALPTNGLNSAKLIAAIKHYQTNVVKLSKADGRIDVGGKTWQSLSGQAPANPAPTTPNSTNSKGMVKPNWITIAEGEKGVKEIAGKAHNKRVIEYHATTGGFKDDETPWCSSFVNWVMTKAGYKGTNNAMAQSWKSWGKKISKPAYGAIAIISYDARSGHVGFVVGKKGNSILLLGGNQSNMVNVTSFSQKMVYVVPSNFEMPQANYNLVDNGGKFPGGDLNSTR